MNTLLNPQVGLQTPPDMTWQQGLMGSVMQPPQMSLPPSLMNYQPGQWSQTAYRMAGSPLQGPYPSVPTPPMPPGANGGTSSSGGGSTAAGTALGLLSVLAKNPSLVKSGYNAVSGLFGGAAAAPAATAFGTDAAVAPASAVTSELPATATGTYAAPAAAGTTAAGAAAPAAGGLLAGGAGTVSGAGAALGAGAPGVFASGSAGAGSAGAAAGASSLGAAGLMIPLAAAAIPFMLGMNGARANDQGNAAMNAWMQANGVTYKPAAWNTNSGQNTFGTQATAHANQSPGTFMGANGQSMTEKQAETALVQWARAHGIPTGNLNYTGG